MDLGTGGYVLCVLRFHPTLETWGWPFLALWSSHPVHTRRRGLGASGIPGEAGVMLTASPQVQSVDTGHWDSRSARNNNDMKSPVTSELRGSAGDPPYAQPGDCHPDLPGARCLGPETNGLVFPHAELGAAGWSYSARLVLDSARRSGQATTETAVPSDNVLLRSAPGLAACWGLAHSGLGHPGVRGLLVSSTFLSSWEHGVTPWPHRALRHGPCLRVGRLSCKSSPSPAVPCVLCLACCTQRAGDTESLDRPARKLRRGYRATRNNTCPACASEDFGCACLGHWHCLT